MLRLEIIFVTVLHSFAMVANGSTLEIPKWRLAIQVRYNLWVAFPQLSRSPCWQRFAFFCRQNRLISSTMLWGNPLLATVLSSNQYTIFYLFSHTRMIERFIVEHILSSTPLFLCSVFEYHSSQRKHPFLQSLQNCRFERMDSNLQVLRYLPPLCCEDGISWWYWWKATDWVGQRRVAEDEGSLEWLLRKGRKIWFAIVLYV